VCLPNLQQPAKSDPPGFSARHGALLCDALDAQGEPRKTLSARVIVEELAARAQAEERRLLYVALTRARKELSVSWSRARTPGGRGSRKPSRFLDGLRPSVPSDRPSSPKAGKQKGCRVCAQPLVTVADRQLGRHETCESAYDEALFERLREWRKRTADEASVPAYVVFTDKTLQAIAEVRPTTQAAMLRINGVGSTKWERYGDEVLAVVNGEI